MKLLIFTCSLFLSLNMFSQESIDANQDFEGVNKKYSIYIPSNYNPSEPNEMLVGFHPFNVNRWDAIAWRDTLIDFAEMNNLLLICPDGGLDGKVDDQIDTLFTTAILDSMLNWYNVDEDKIFAAGFSQGGKATYTYGLSHPELFAGLMPIGAAIRGGEDFSHLKNNAKNEYVFVIHGDNDNVWLRYLDAIDTLISGEACVDSTLLLNVGHTIDFENRNEIMTEALQFLRDANCTINNNVDHKIDPQVDFYPNPAYTNQRLTLIGLEENQVKEILIFSQNGTKLIQSNHLADLSLSGLDSGIYLLQLITVDNNSHVKPLFLW